MLRIIEKGKCLPVTLDEVKNHLSVDYSSRSNDAFIETLIDATSQASEQHTGRVWVESKWEWTPEEIFVGGVLEFPIAPVTKVQVFDLDEEKEEDQEFTDISGDVVSVKYPSPEPQGSPLMGSLLPISGFPTNFKIVLTVGYPVQEIVEAKEQTDAPILVVEKTRYSLTKTSLVFNRPVFGIALPENFKILQDGEELLIDEVLFEKGRIDLVFSEGALKEGLSLEMSFIEGEVHDEFGNFVQPILNLELPQIAFVEEEAFEIPEPVPTTSTFYSQAPSAVKSAMLLNIAFLYTQRTGGALKTGKEIEKNFSDQVARMLLNPYRTRFI